MAFWYVELFCKRVCSGDSEDGFGICSLKLQSLVRTFAIFLPSAFVSGFFYSQVLLSLAQSKQNSSKRHLTVVLLILWLSWIMMSAPYLVYDLFRTLRSLEQKAFRVIQDVVFYLELTFTYVSVLHPGLTSSTLTIYVRRCLTISIHYSTLFIHVIIEKSSFDPCCRRSFKDVLHNRH